jgi:hypothetical protein
MSVNCCNICWFTCIYTFSFLFNSVGPDNDDNHGIVSRARVLHLSFSLLRSHRRHDPHQVLLFLCWNVLILFSSTLGYSHSRRRGCRRVIKSAWWNNKKKRGGTAIRRADDLRIVEMLLVILCAVGSRQQQLCVTHYTFRKSDRIFLHCGKSHQVSGCCFLRAANFTGWNQIYRELCGALPITWILN